MRVALVGPYPLPETPPRGGVETAFESLVEGLSGIPDVEPRVISFTSGLAAPIQAHVGHVPIQYLPAPRRLNYVTFHASVRGALTRALSSFGPDVVHAQDAVSFGYVCLKAEPRAPVVVSIHGVVREEAKYSTALRDRVRMKVLGVYVQRYCMRHAPYLLEATRYSEEYFGRHIRGKVVEVGLPIPNRFFHVSPAPEPGRILYAGRIVPVKRLLDLVSALPLLQRMVPEAHLRVAGGDVDPSYAERVRARVRELGLDRSVTMLGPLPTDAMVQEYQQAAVLALPSAQESSPMVIGEALAASLPVVATRTGGVASLVDDGRTGHLVDVGDDQALADRIVDVLSDPEAQARLAAAARQRALELFDARVVASRVHAVYRAALASG